MKQIFGNRGKNQLTFETVENVLLNVAEIFVDSSSETSIGDALLASKNRDKKGFQKENRNNTDRDCTCFVCGKEGHKAKNF